MHDYTLKFIIIGNSHVGKSNILSRYTNKHYETDHNATIGVEFAIKTVTFNKKIYKLQIWDTAGQEAFRSITRSYYRGAVCCIIVFDVTDRQTFVDVPLWIEELKVQCVNPYFDKCVKILIGNKIDLVSNRDVSKYEAEEYANMNDMLYYETSVKNQNSIDYCFSNAVAKIDEKIMKTEIIINEKKNVINNNNTNWMNGCYC
jgi:Ras-related protein Rab-2A